MKDGIGMVSPKRGTIQDGEVEQEERSTDHNSCRSLIMLRLDSMSINESSLNGCLGDFGKVTHNDTRVQRQSNQGDGEQ